MRLKTGLVEDLDTAVDLQKMARLVDKIGELFEEEDLTADEAVWAAALGYLSIFNATDSFANTELLNTAARALLREASDVFESLPEPGEKVEPSGEPEPDDDDDDDEPEPEEEELEEELDEEDLEPPDAPGVEGTEIPDAGE
jgi:hypothetical protein